MIDLKGVPIEDIIKALRKVKGVNCYIIEDKYVIEIQKGSVNYGTKIN